MFTLCCIFFTDKWRRVKGRTEIDAAAQRRKEKKDYEKEPGKTVRQTAD